MDLELTPLTMKESMTQTTHQSYIIVGHTKGRHVRFTVVCRDIHRAIELALQAHPELNIQSANHTGAIQKIEL